MDDAERNELDQLRAEVASLRAQLAARSTRESALAALNLMADANTARREAEAASRVKEGFLAVVSHELRTPLAAITLWARAARTSDADPELIERAIRSIEQSADCQSRLIDDILDLSRLGSGKLTLAREPTDVRAHVEAAIDAVRPLAEPKGVTLSKDLAPDLGWMFLDGTRLTQVLWNLLTNAIKFTFDGGHVRVSAHARRKRLDIDVADDGEGISAQFLPHVFEKFRQGEMGSSRRHVGLGIGLTLVKELVELHGGTVEAASDGLGRGATFRVVLPREEREELEATVLRAAPSLDALRVLLVEDDVSTRAAMAWTLQHAGATVWPVSNAHDALIALDHADVLVSDIGLPGMDGVELVSRVVESCRARGERPMPSCAISAHTRDADRRGAIDAGFDIFLPKPVSADHLIEAVADLRAML